MAFKVVEPVCPQPPIGLQPVIEFAQRLGSNPIEPSLRVDSDLNKSRLAEHPQMLGDGRLAQFEGADQRAYRLLGPAKQAKDVAAVWFGEDVQSKAHEVEYAETGIFRASYIR